MPGVKTPPGIAKNPAALAMWARGLFMKDQFDEAFAAALAAVELAPDDAEIRDLVAAFLSTTVAHYHIPMLNDGPRNRAYARALEAAIRPGMRVLEVGTGGGLLALIAARAGAEVFTCESSPVAAAAARVIAERNGLADRIHVISKRSTELAIGDDLPGPADLLFSEIFGGRLFDEGVVESLADAKARLVKPGAPVVPRWAELRCALVETPDKARSNPIGTVEGFDMSAVNVLMPPANVRLNCTSGSTEQRSQPGSALAKDFHAEPPFGDDIGNLELISDGGRVNGVAQWLRLDFGDGNILENSPFTSEESNWGRPLTLFAAPLDTRPGQIVRVRLRRVGETLIVSQVASTHQ